ncbi:hypothetical protein Ae201684P_012850 [Aphanomyces euteiches]|nr:hypothetical protein Ae201684P_012850 [Aphanomyces euteiches]
MLATGDSGRSRRLYFQAKQREHRSRIKKERESLLEELAHLQKQAKNLPSFKLVDENGMLSWQAIASVFQDESRRCKGDRGHLQNDVASNTVLIHEMMRFLNACRPRPKASIASTLPLHQHVTLLAHREAREKAKQWLVQQLYHNTDRASTIFQPYMLQMNLSIASCQVIWSYSLEDIKDAFIHTMNQTAICNATEGEIEREGNTVLARGFTQDKYPWHLLRGHFHEADRFIAVFRYLNDDEAFDGREDPDFYEMQWFDIRRISPTSSAVRILCHRPLLLEDMKKCAKLENDDTLEQDVSSKNQKSYDPNNGVFVDFGVFYSNMTKDMAASIKQDYVKKCFALS